MLKFRYNNIGLVIDMSKCNIIYERRWCTFCGSNILTLFYARWKCILIWGKPFYLILLINIHIYLHILFFDAKLMRSPKEIHPQQLSTKVLHILPWGSVSLVKYPHAPTAWQQTLCTVDCRREGWAAGIYIPRCRTPRQILSRHGNKWQWYYWVEGKTPGKIRETDVRIK